MSSPILLYNTFIVHHGDHWYNAPLCLIYSKGDCMRFNALQFNERRLGLSGQYSQRVDGSIVLEIDKMIPYTEMCRLTTERLSYLWMRRTNGDGWIVHRGPFTLKEQYGLIILTLDQ